MHTAHYAATLGVALRRRNLWMVLALLLAVANVLLTGFVITRAQHERLVVVPPGFDRPFWVQSTAVSDSYLEQMAVYVVELALSYNPQNVEYRVQQLLSLTRAPAYATLSRRLQADTERIVRNKVSAVFHPQGVRLRPGERKAAVTGLHTRMIGGKISDSRQRLLVVEFGEGPRLRVRALHEVDPGVADPFVATADVEAP